MNKEEVHTELVTKLKFNSDDLRKLSIFHDELLRFNKKYNLISKSTELHVWDRHILDSAQLVRYIDFDKDKSLSDMGSGAGFPGIVLAIFNKNPKFHVKLYDKSNIKCDFLDNIRNKLDIDYDKVIEYTIHDDRLGTSHWKVPGPDGDFGFGGHCFPKDLSAIIKLSDDLGSNSILLKSIIKSNDKVRKNRDWEKMKGRAVI